MIHINEPVSDWLITVTELATADRPHQPKRLFNILKFKTVKELGLYLRKTEKYAIARSLGVKLKKPHDPASYHPGLIGRLSFKYTDRMVSPELEFDTVNDFAEWLQEHPPLAKAVEYDQKFTGGQS